MRGRLPMLLAGLWAGLAGCGDGTAPEGRVRDDRLTVFFAPAVRPEWASVVGDLNAWDRAANPMADPDGDGIYSAVIDPPAGDHLYGILVGRETFLDPYNPLTMFDATGEEYSWVRVDPLDQPALELMGFELGVGGDLAAEVGFLRGRSSRRLDPRSVLAMLDGTTPVAARIEPGEILTLDVTGLAEGKHRLKIAAADRKGVQATTLSLPFWVEESPFDWRDAIIYQVVVDRFQSGEGPLDPGAGISCFQGGDLFGVLESLEEGYFDSLGVNALWISPMYAQAEGSFVGRDGHLAEAYHGYWPAEARQVEPRFGGADGLEALVAAAHARGMRVIMDAVPNHLHEQHPYAAEHADGGWFNHPLGECVCGFTCPWAGYMESCWFDPFLPDLRWRNPEVVEQVTADLVWWLERFDLDGLRLDAVPMMPRLAVRHLRARIEAALGASGLHTFLLGETYAFSGGQEQIRYYLGPHSLSGQFDYPVLWALRDALTGQVGLDELDTEVRSSQAAWAGSGAVMAPVLGSHDTPRLISVLNADPVNQPRDLPPPQPVDAKAYDLLRLAWTFVLTQPGAPVIYYGDEIGLAGGQDPDNRRGMVFADELSDLQAQVLSHVVRLGRARACSQALRRGERVTLFAIPNLYAYARSDAGGHPALVVLNPTTGSRQVDLEVPAAWPLAEGAVFADLFGTPVVSDGRRVSLSVPPRSGAVLLSESDCIGGES